MATDQEHLRTALCRAEACLKEIERDVMYGCWTDPGHRCPCSSAAREVYMAFLWITAWKRPENLPPGYQWLAERLTEGTALWNAYEAVPLEPPPVIHRAPRSPSNGGTESGEGR